MHSEQSLAIYLTSLCISFLICKTETLRYQVHRTGARLQWFDTYKTHTKMVGICIISISVQFSSVAHLCPTLWDTMDCSTPGLSVHHQLPEFTQIHVHWVGDDIQLSHPLLSPSPTTFSLSQHQGIFQWVSSSHQVVKVVAVLASTSILPVNLQDWFPLKWTGWISLQSKGLSRVFSNTTV